MNNLLSLTQRNGISENILRHLGATFLRTNLLNSYFQTDDSFQGRAAIHECVRAYFNNVNLSEYISQIHSKTTGICFIDLDPTIELQREIQADVNHKMKTVVNPILVEDMDQKRFYNPTDKRIARNLAIDTDSQIVREVLLLSDEEFFTVSQLIQLLDCTAEEAECIKKMPSIVTFYDAISQYHHDVCDNEIVITSIFGIGQEEHLKRFKKLLIDTVYTHFTVMRLIANKATTEQINEFNFPVRINARTRTRFTLIYEPIISEYRHKVGRFTTPRQYTTKEKIDLVIILKKLQNKFKSDAELLIHAAEQSNKDIIQFRDILKVIKKENCHE